MYTLWTFDILEIVLINIHNFMFGYFIFLFLTRDADHVRYNFAFCLGLYQSTTEKSAFSYTAAHSVNKSKTHSFKAGLSF